MNISGLALPERQAARAFQGRGQPTTPDLTVL
jgi:hypothetical protein